MPDYGREHKRLRALLLAAYVPGITRCARCGKPITTLNTRLIHLGHDDDNPLVWRGLEHKFCNESAGGRIGGPIGAAITNAKLGPWPARRRRRSRIW